MKVKKLNVSIIKDMVDAAIIHLCINGISRIVIYKTVFLYLYSITKTNNYSFKTILDITGFKPDLYGPISDFVDNEIGSLWKIEDLGPSENIYIYKTNKNKLMDYPVNNNEMNIINDILQLTELTNQEFAFYVYFNPFIPKYIKRYYMIHPEIKYELIKNKEIYIKNFQKKGIMDNDSADLIRYNFYPGGNI